MEKKVLHIVNDEKFIVDADSLLKDVPGFLHQYAVVGAKKKLKNLNSLNVLFIHPFLLVTGLKIGFINQYDAVIFHGLKGFKFKLLQRINNRIPIAWIGWGYDYYSLFDSNRKDFLLPYTKFATESLQKKNKSMTKRFIRFFEPGIKSKLKALKKVNYFNTVVQEDYYILKKTIGPNIPVYMDWNYPILKDNLIKSQSFEDLTGNNLIIGNSGATTNNHIDAFRRVKSSKFYDYDEVICPLSYGGSKKYLETVISEGKEVFLDKFQPLTEFYSAPEYFKILNGCGYYFSPTLRQQAFGNILLMLYLGKSVILFKENPVYRSLVDLNIRFFCVEDLDNNTLRKLLKKEIEKNRKIILENYSESVLKWKSKKFLNDLVGYSENKKILNTK